MIILRQKSFNSKEQKARRRKYDLEQGASSNYDKIVLGDDEKILKDAKAQDKMIGRKKTKELLEKGEKSATSTKDFIGRKKVSFKVHNKKELDELERAQNLLRAGRERSRDIKFPRIYEGKEPNIHHLINEGDSHSRYSSKSTIKDALKNSPNRIKAEQEAAEKLKKNLKTGGKIALGTIAAAGLAYGGKKVYDHYKKKKEEEK